MNYSLVVILSFSISIPAIIGLIRFMRMDQAYYPFVILIWLGLINETVSFFVTKAGHSNAMNINIYALGEGLLIILFFKQLKLFDKGIYLFYCIITLITGAWIIDKFIVSNIKEFSSYFSIIASFTYVLMSINMINHLMIVENRKLIRNALFLICVGFIMFFTYALLVEIFWFYGLNSSTEFRFRVYRIMTYINLSANLIFALAILWIPKKREYTLL